MPFPAMLTAIVYKLETPSLGRTRHWYSLYTTALDMEEHWQLLQANCSHRIKMRRERFREIPGEFSLEEALRQYRDELRMHFDGAGFAPSAVQYRRWRRPELRSLDVPLSHWRLFIGFLDWKGFETFPMIEDGL